MGAAELAASIEAAMYPQEAPPSGIAAKIIHEIFAEMRMAGPADLVDEIAGATSLWLRYTVTATRKRNPFTSLIFDSVERSSHSPRCNSPTCRHTLRFAITILPLPSFSAVCPSRACSTAYLSLPCHTPAPRSRCSSQGAFAALTTSTDSNGFSEVRAIRLIPTWSGYICEPYSSSRRAKMGRHIVRQGC